MISASLEAFVVRYIWSVVLGDERVSSTYLFGDLDGVFTNLGSVLKDEFCESI